MGKSVEEVLAALSIEHEAARNGWIVAKCPFHDDHSPSWRIRVTAVRYGQHHCWACKEGGTLAMLVMHGMKWEYAKAAEWVGKHDQPVEMPIPEEVGIELVNQVRKFRLPEEIIFDELQAWVTPAKHYMAMRSIPDWQVHRWGIGYALAGRLAGRIVIPVWKSKGVARNYMARDFTDDVQAPRYMYPKREEGADHATMFGELHWPSARDIVVIPEGAFNALAVERLREPRFAVAALGGSSVQAIHVLKIASFDLAIILTDNDPAGQHASDALEPLLRGQGKRPRRCRLPKGMDANDMSAAALRTALWRSVSGEVTVT